MPDDLFPSAVRLSRQGGPSGFWLLGVERELSGLPGGRERVNVRLTAAQMSELVSTWQAITEPPPVRPFRPADLPREYHVEIVGPRLGWWWYTITGEGLMDYSEWQPLGLPRRSRAAALRHAQARVDRLARRDARGPEERDMRPRVP